MTKKKKATKPAGKQNKYQDAPKGPKVQNKKKGKKK